SEYDLAREKPAGSPRLPLPSCLSLTLDRLLQSLLLRDLQSGVLVALDHGAKLSGRDVLNDAAGLFDPGAEFFGLDNFLGRGRQRINDRLGRAGADEGASPAVEIISLDSQLVGCRDRGQLFHLVAAHERQRLELARAL